MDDTNQPTTTTIPSSPPSQPPQHPQRPTSLHTLLLKTDRTILRLSTLLSNPSSTDALLCTTSYTLSLLHALLSRLLARRLAAIASAIATKPTPVLIPGSTLIATIPAPLSTRLLAHTVGTSKALASTIADYRIFVRLWGLVGMYTWLRATYSTPLPQTSSQKEKVLRGLTYTSILSCVGFQVLENGAYLASKGALTTSGWAGDKGRARENKWWVWSSRFWAVYVGVELCRLGVEGFWKESQAQTQTPSTQTQSSTEGKEGIFDDGEKEDKIRKVEEARLKNWLWWKDVISNLAYAPMTLHWSTETGLLSDWGVGACGVVAGGANLVDAWRRTA